MGKAISLQAAQAAVLSKAKDLLAVGVEDCQLSSAQGRTLAQRVASTLDFPGFDNSAMDGYALRSFDVAAATSAEPVALQIVGQSRAGVPGPEVSDGQAVQISTGAMLPEGADCVLRVEDSAVENGTLTVASLIAAGNDVRRRGEELAAGTVVLQPGTQIAAGEIAMLASLGLSTVRVAAPPRIAIITTGDETVNQGVELAPGQIYDSNTQMLVALAQAAGCQVVKVTAGLQDDLSATAAAVEAASQVADIVVTCGGVSMGQHDHVKPAFKQLGVDEIFWQVALRPGHPTWFGCRQQTLFFGLPGNPVSAYVTFKLFVELAVARMLGRATSTTISRAHYEGPAIKKRIGVSQVIRVVVAADQTGQTVAKLSASKQQSHMISSLLGSPQLAILAEDVAEVHAGDLIDIVLVFSKLSAKSNRILGLEP